MSSDPDSSISFQLTDMFSIINKLSSMSDHTGTNVKGRKRPSTKSISQQDLTLCLSPAVRRKQASHQLQPGLMAT